MQNHTAHQKYMQEYPINTRTHLWVPEWGWEWMRWEFVASTYKQFYREWIKNNILVYSTENHIQYSMINHSGKEYEKKGVYMYN